MPALSHVICEDKPLNFRDFFSGKKDFRRRVDDYGAPRVAPDCRRYCVPSSAWYQLPAHSDLYSSAMRLSIKPQVYVMAI